MSNFLDMKIQIEKCKEARNTDSAWCLRASKKAWEINYLFRETLWGDRNDATGCQTLWFTAPHLRIYFRMTKKEKNWQPVKFQHFTLRNLMGCTGSGSRGKKTEKRGTEGRTQENKSTGDRNAQLSSEPEARSALTSEVCASAPLWSSAWHSLHYNNVFKTRGGGRKKTPKKSQTDTSARTRTARTHTPTQLRMVVLTRKTSVQRQPPGAKLKWHEER